MGACPDTWDIRGGCTNDLTNVTGFRRDRFQCVSFSRLMDTGGCEPLPKFFFGKNGVAIVGMAGDMTIGGVVIRG